MKVDFFFPLDLGEKIKIRFSNLQLQRSLYITLIEIGYNTHCTILLNSRNWKFPFKFVIPSNQMY